jgi:hypothetical protein
MNVRDWNRFLDRGPPGRIIRLAQLSDDLTRAVDAASNVVHLEHSYALKFIAKQHVKRPHFPMLDETIDRGAVVRDGAQFLVFLYYDEFVWNRWFRVSVKRCNLHRKFWIHTFHLTTWEQVRSKMRRFPVLRELKG